MTARTYVPIALFLLSRLLFGSTIEEAQNLENAGRKSEAIVVFSRWLEDNGNHPDAVAALIHASSLFEDPLETVSFLSKYVHLLPDDKRGEVFARMAGLEASLGLPGFAVKHYDLALQHGGAQHESWRLQYLQLKDSIGEDIRAEALALKNTARNRAVIAESGLLAALALADSDIRQGIAEIQELIENDFRTPSIWLYLAKLQARMGDNEGVEESLRNLESEYPGSAHIYTAQSRILEWVSPAVLMEDSLLRSASSVQAGVFKKRDVAAKMRKNLEQDGFTAWLELMDNNLWKVKVNDPDGKVGERLRAKGYDVSH